jgi:hypothetical protein
MLKQKKKGEKEEKSDQKSITEAIKSDETTIKEPDRIQQQITGSTQVMPYQVQQSGLQTATMSPEQYSILQQQQLQQLQQLQLQQMQQLQQRQQQEQSEQQEQHVHVNQMNKNHQEQELIDPIDQPKLPPSNPAEDDSKKDE